MDNRNAWLLAHRRRKIEPADGLNVITSIFDEIAVYATVLGTEQEQRLFVSLLRDLVARGRNVAMPVIAATSPPQADQRGIGWCRLWWAHQAPSKRTS